MMPGINGHETIKAIVDEDLMDGNIVCMLTAVHEPTEALQEVDEYVLDYICKPFTATELLEAVEEAISILQTDPEVVEAP